MKLYLDTSIIWGWFKRMMENLRKKKPFRIPLILNFIKSRPELELMTSVVTQIEIFRFLRSEWNCDKRFSLELWNTFSDFFNITNIDVKEIDFKKLMKISLEVPTKKKTLVNLEHLEISKKNGFYFLTGEEKLKEKYKKYYDNILTYKELRKLFA